jgi:nitronate monooxygenase
MIQELPAAAKTFCEQLGIRYPVIGGAMYPCSNPELTAAVSAAGGIGILQPISLTYVHGHEYRTGIRLMRSLTDNPVGMNALIEKSSKRYHQRMSEWIDIALDEGVRFFVTSLGKPDWVVERVHAAG